MTGSGSALVADGQAAWCARAHVVNHFPARAVGRLALADTLQAACPIGGDAWPEMHDNRVYTLDGNASESGGSLASWQAQGVDVGTTIAGMPPDDAIIAMGRAVLQM